MLRSNGGAFGHAHSQPHDFIKFYDNSKSRIIDEALPLYQKGLSLREVERVVGIPKSTILSTFNQEGVVLRSYRNVPSGSISKAIGSRPGKPPFGFSMVEGQRVKDRREWPIVQEILAQWRSGSVPQAIADFLNAKRLLSRTGGRWFAHTVREVIKRQTNKKENPNGN